MNANMTLVFRFRTLGRVFLGAVLLFSAIPSHGQLIYDGRLGYVDAEHTTSSGYQRSELTGVAGTYFRGKSVRYNGGSSPLGDSAWVTQGATGQMVQVGLQGSPFGSPTGPRDTQINFLNAAGYSAGSSAYYTGASFLGNAAWVADSAGTVRHIGLFNTLSFFRNDGYRNSTVNGLTATGYAYGTSDIYNGSPSVIGQAAWIAGPTTPTMRVGLVGAGFDGADGRQFSAITAVNRSGAGVGNSLRYAGGTTSVGQSAWRSSSLGVSQIGLYDPEHTRNDGYVFSAATFLSETGYAAGYSKRYAGSSENGQSAWRINPAGALEKLGFRNGEYSDGGSFYSEVTGLLSDGTVFGFSVRNNTGGYASTAWAANTTGGIQTLGLSGTGYSNYFGFSSNRPVFGTETGFVAGTTVRFNPTNFAIQGTAIFVQNLSSGDAAVAVGLYDAAHTGFGGTVENRIAYLTGDGRSSGMTFRADGGESVWAAQSNGTTFQVGNYSEEFALSGPSVSYYRTIQSGMTESGYVWGLSQRGAGGYAGWLFSLDTQEQISLADFDVVGTSGFGQSAFRGVTEDGVGYGYYYVYDTETGLGRDVGFIWSEALGLVPIEDAIAGGVGHYDWEAFQTAYFAVDGSISGNGLLSDGSMGAYLVVPEPSTGVLAGLAVFALALSGLRKRRRQRAR